jgi:hypothetical protein
MASNGLIDDTADVAGTKVPQATAATYNPAQAAATTTAPTKSADFSAVESNDDQLVQSRIKGIIDENSPLMQQAGTAAKQVAAQRGLVNSSMAVTAGQDALYRAAMPIAQQDAQTRAQQAMANAQDKNQTTRFNVAETNKGEQFNVGETNQTARLNTTEANKAGEFNAGQVNNAQQMNIKAQMDMKLQQLDAVTRTNLVNIEANYKTLMQASQSASDLYQQTVDAISKLQNNKDLDAASRNKLIEQQTQLLQSGMNLIGNMNNLNLGSLLDFSSVNAAGAGATGRTETISPPSTDVAEFQPAGGP